MSFERLFFSVLGFFLRLGLLLIGLLVMVLVLALSVLMLVGWGLYALVARLLGRPVQPLAFTILRQTQAQFFRRAQARPGAPGGAEVIDVNSREVDASPSDRLGR
ncbi:hypothetical protein DW355_16710 [Hylemonella gracilis]|jgi:hypothetical protein|uniref:DUF4389 domain-containing protein n=1 Tax=Hylemonella gracilis TaxID=80880 RepID=A0A4P6UL72_9BURK|nr:hypothetical protein [Hylemonella gracilis]QBK06138.1 hypothetical protein DW355_16710 [Hylemonella gracilis]